MWQIIEGERLSCEAPLRRARCPLTVTCGQRAIIEREGSSRSARAGQTRRDGVPASSTRVARVASRELGKNSRSSFRRVIPASCSTRTSEIRLVVGAPLPILCSTERQLKCIARLRPIFLLRVNLEARSIAQRLASRHLSRRDTPTRFFVFPRQENSVGRRAGGHSRGRTLHFN